MARSKSKTDDTATKPPLIRRDRLLLALDVLRHPYEITLGAVDGVHPHNPRGLSLTRINRIAYQFGSQKELWTSEVPLHGLESLLRCTSDAEIDISAWVEPLRSAGTGDKSSVVEVCLAFIFAIAFGELTEEDFQE